MDEYTSHIPALSVDGDVDPSTGATYKPVSDQVLRAARITVCSRSRDVEEAREFLAALGLIPAPARATVAVDEDEDAISA